MALLHSTLFYRGVVTILNPATILAYTVPAGYRIVLRSVSAQNQGSTPTVLGFVRISGVFVHQFNLTGAGTSGGYAEWRPWIVAGPGDTINLSTSGSPGIGFVISGSLYYL